LHRVQNALVYPLGLAAVHWAGLPHSCPYVPGSALVHFNSSGFSGFMFWAPVVGTIPATTLCEGLALALSDCSDWDNPACDTVGLLGFAAVCPKTNDLFSVGALAKGAKGTGHVVGCLGGANQHRAAFGCLAVLWRVHGDNNGDWQTMGGESVGLLYIVCAEIHGETPLCSVLGPSDSVRAVLVGVGKPVSASVGSHDLAQCVGVHLFTLSG
jgi:hypothetical protein